jgi:hypothetical protein
MLKQLQLTNPIIQMRYILPRILGILQWCAQPSTSAGKGGSR